MNLPRAHEDRDPPRRRHRPRDRARGRARPRRAARATGSPLETETAPIGGAGYDAAGHPLPEATLALARAADAVLLGAVGGPKYDTLPRALRPEQGILGIRKALGLFANLRPALLYPGARRRLDAEARGRRRARPHDHPRADRRHLLRPAARAAHQRRGRGRGLRHDALQRERDPPHRARRLRDGAEARQEAVLGRQGERARHQHPVARGRHRDGAPTTPTSRCRTCTSTTRRCSWCATRSSST